MKQMKRLISAFLIVLLLAAFPLQANAANVSIYEAADALSTLGLLRGTGNGLELERAATRAESVVMLLRLLGREGDAVNETGICPFDDGGWAAQQLTYAWKNELVLGRSDTHFGSTDDVSCRDFVTMLLRALGYSDTQGDFTWRECISFADSIGLCHGEYTADGAFLRGDMVLLAYSALTLRLKGSERTLAEQLYLDGVLSDSAIRETRVFNTATDTRREYDAVEIHDRYAPAVFLVDIYRDEEALQKDKAKIHGSGFFISADGIAVMCYHEINGYEYARITTLDGHRYDVTEILGYDAFWDTVVFRVSKTDINGEAADAFPYLSLGNSDAIRTGEKVFTLSSALGLEDNITDGLVSNRSRIVDDPDYRSIQITAPISPGSSGGALLNRYGEVIGILYASFTRGENMNLAIPINQIASLKQSGNGDSIKEIKQIEDAKKAAATISVSQTELTLNYGEEAEVLVTHTAPNTAEMRYTIDRKGIVECQWEDFVSKHSAPLTITAIGDGSTEITISFTEDEYSRENSVVIHVTVIGGPEEPEEDLPTGTTGSY